MSEEPAPPPVIDDDAFADDVVLPPRPMKDDAELDMTPMIDVVFLLLIFFLVSSTPDQTTSVELPPAQYGQGVDQQSSIVITLAKREGSRSAAVYLADGTIGEPLPDDPTQKEAAVVAAVEKGFLGGEGKTSVLIKAARDVKEGDVHEVAKAVGKAEVEDVKLHFAVFEED